MPDQIEKDWQAIYEAIKESFPPLADATLPEHENNLFTSLMSGVLECWVLYEGEDPWIIGTLQVTREVVTGTKNLLVYSILAYKPIPLQVWYSLFVKFRQRCKELGCSKVVAFSNVDRVVQLVKSLGGRSDFKLLWLEV